MSCAIYVPQIAFKSFKISLQYLEKEPLKVLKLLRTEFMDRNLIFQHILTKTLKQCSKNSLQYLDRILDRNNCLNISNYSAHMHIFYISICYKSSFSALQTIKVSFFILFFSFCSPLSFSPLSPPSVRFPLGNSGKNSFSGDLVGPVFQRQAKWQIARA